MGVEPGLNSPEYKMTLEAHLISWKEMPILRGDAEHYVTGESVLICHDCDGVELIYPDAGLDWE